MVRNEIVDGSLNTIEKIIHSKKINYKLLNEIMKPYVNEGFFKGSDEVTIYVDVFDVIKKLYSPIVMEEIHDIKNDLIITSEIINIISHYRHYFASRLKKYTTFMFYYSSKESEFTSYFNDYRKDFYEKRLNRNNIDFIAINKSLDTNIKLMKTIVNYIPHAYFIDTDKMEYQILPTLGIDKNVPTIILSNESILYQNLLLSDRVAILECRGEKSQLTSKCIIMDTLFKKVKNKVNISPNTFLILQALSGYKYFNVPPVINGMSYYRAAKKIKGKIDEESVPFDKESIVEVMSCSGILNESQMKRFKLNLELLNYIDYVPKEITNAKINSCLQDKKDPYAIRKINEQFFGSNPVLLSYCFEGEEY